MSEAESDTIRSGFIRQRRNLILISLVLLFAETAKLKIEKLNVFGNELLIGNPVIVNYALWVAFTYWFLRYLVYFHDLGDIGYQTRRNDRLRMLVSRWAKKQFMDNQAWRDRVVKIVRDNITSAQPSHIALHDHMETSNDWEMREAILIGIVSRRTITVQPQLDLFVMATDGRRKIVEGFGTSEITGRAAFILNAKAALYVVTRTRILTEYYLPIGVALLPLLFLLYRMAVR